MSGAGPRAEDQANGRAYGADPSDSLRIIHAAATEDPKRLLLVGHNPGLHELAFALTGSGQHRGAPRARDNLPTSGLAVIDFDIDDWDDVRSGAAGSSCSSARNC